MSDILLTAVAVAALAWVIFILLRALWLYFDEADEPADEGGADSDYVDQDR